MIGKWILIFGVLLVVGRSRGLADRDSRLPLRSLAGRHSDARRGLVVPFSHRNLHRRERRADRAAELAVLVLAAVGRLA